MRSNVIVRLKYFLCFLNTCILFSSCYRQFHYAWVTPQQIIFDSSLTKKYGASPCLDFHNYIPDTLHPKWQPPRYVRMNMHFMRNSDGSGTFPSEKEAIDFSQNLMWSVYGKLANNKQMFLPAGNNTPALHTGFEAVIAPDTSVRDDIGIYFHDHDSSAVLITGGKYRNVESPYAYNRFGVMKGSVINVFFYENNPDSLNSKTFHLSGDGIGAGNWMKMLGVYQTMMVKQVINGDTILRGPWMFAGLFDHELGHCLGLSHTWNSNDGCDDTPTNPNCWGCSNECSSCSNNVMDYNAYQEAWTPCQLGKIHLNFSNPKSTIRNYLKPEHCEYHPDWRITIPANDTVIWSGFKDLWGDVVISENAVLVLRCDVSLPNGAKVTMKKGATLICAGGTFYNSCGEFWQGIEVPEGRWSFVKIICAPGCAPRDMWFGVKRN